MAHSSTDQKAPAGGGGLPIGAKVGKYELVERLGAGGQSIVYKAHDPLLDRHVAIKQVAPQLASDRAYAERFRDIARRLARLGCEEIVTIYELIEGETGIFVVMEFVPGHTIETTLATQSEPVEPKAVLQIIWRIGAGLAALHKAGIVHRDIKPGNIIVGEGLRVTITDFGVAARAGTPVSMKLGTTKYMAPELFAGAQVDGRADIYSLGMVAYEMLLGREKFREVFREVVRDPHSEALRWMKWHSSPEQVAPLLHELNPAVPVPLSLIVARMLAKDAEERFANMEALGREVRANFSPRSQRPSPRGAKKTRVSVQAAADAEARGATGAGILDADEAEDLTVRPEQAAPAEPLTAEIPKRPMSLKRKLLLVGTLALTVLIAVVVGEVIKSGKGRELRRAAEREYSVAADLYRRAGIAETLAEKKRLYQEAQEKFETVARKYSRQVAARQATVRIYICQAHLNVIARDWRETDRKVTLAEEVRKGLERSGGQLYRWTEKVQRELGDFRDYWLSQRQYVEAMEQAEKAIEAGKLRVAAKLLAERAAPAATVPEQGDAILALRRDIVEKQKQEEYWELVRRGDEHADEGGVTSATASYDEAIKLLESEKDKLEPKIYSSLKRTAELKRNLLVARTKYRAAVRAARKEGRKDRLAGAKAYRDAIAEFDAQKAKIPPDQHKELMAIADPAILTDSAKDLEHDHWLEMGREHLAAGRVYPAQEALRKAQKIKDSPAVQNELGKIQRQKDHAAIVRAAYKLYRERSYEAALVKYKEALKFPGASRVELKARVDACEYEIEITSARAHIAKSEWNKAKAALLRAKRKRPTHLAEVDAMIMKLDQDRIFARFLTEAEKAHKQRNWLDALKNLKEAQKLRPKAAEVDLMIRKIHYEQHVQSGLASMEEKDYKSALAYFKLAKGFAIEETEEIDKLINKAEEALQAQGDEG